ncbi:MAG TPA: hypothetical protein VL282_07660, partial [Tepidisphaeraceae bacterium]|nr:hypothetical protein [Tepidisphaeraceae bacterium]
MKPSLISSSLTTLALAGVLYGCGSDSHPPKAPPVQPAQSGAQASSYTPPRADTMQPLTMGQFRGDLVQAQKDIDGTLASLNDLTNPSQQNLRTAYDTYCDRLA